jgi:hypothetical protein
MLGDRGFEALASLVDDSDSYEFCYSVLDEAVAAFDALAAAGAHQ